MSETAPIVTQEPEPLVLVVDDEHRVRELLEIAFTNQGFRVISAGDGEEAVRRAAEQQPDLVILDVRLPRRSGLEACEMIRQSPRETPVGIILVSAAIENELRFQGFNRGADDYLAKPFSPRELIARSRRLVARTRDLMTSRRRVAELEREMRRSWDESGRARAEARRAARLAELFEQAREEMARAPGFDERCRAMLARVRTELAARQALMLLHGDRHLVPLSDADSWRGAPLVHSGDLVQALSVIGRPVSARALESLADVGSELGPLLAGGYDLFVPICLAGRLEALILADGGGLHDRERLERVEALCRLMAPLLARERADRGRTLDLLRLLVDSTRSRGRGEAHFESARRIESAAAAAGIAAPWPEWAALAVELRAVLEEPGGREALDRLAALDPTRVASEIEALTLGPAAPGEAAGRSEARRLVELGDRIAALMESGVDGRTAARSAAIETPGLPVRLRLALDEAQPNGGSARHPGPRSFA